MPRNLSLTQEQEKKLVLFLKKRLPELRQENDERIKADKQSDLDYENDKRERNLPGTIYAESNMPVPLTSTVVDHFAARTEEEIFSRSPMSHFDPEGPADQDIARGLDRYSNYKLFKLGNVDGELLESHHTAFRHRVQILKAIYQEDLDEWEERGVSVLHSTADGRPVLVLNHGYVVEGRDKWLDVTDPIDNQPRQVLAADPTITDDPTLYHYAPLPQPIRFKDVLYAGPKSREVDSDCFLAPVDARCLDEADIMAESYDKPIFWIRDRFLDRPWLTWEQYRNRLARKDGSRKTEDERKKVSREARKFDLDQSSVGITEIWLERDVLDWGQPQRIVLWFDKETDTVLDHEFQKLVTPDGRHPYSTVAVAKFKSYWWGKSIPELLRPFQEYIDRQWNRHSFRNSINANPIIAENPNAIQEQKTFRDLVPFEVVTLEAGKTIQDWIQAFAFPNTDTDTQELIDKAIYWVNFWLGISNIARGDYSDVPQNTTLGGQEASLKEAGKLSKRWSRRVIEGYEDHLTKLVKVLLATMNPEEAYTYLEGDQTQVGFITQESVRDMAVNAKLVVGQDNSTQRLQEKQLVLQTVTQYLSYPPQVQAVVRPVMKQMLFALGQDDVDNLLPPPLMPAINPATGQTVMMPVTPQTPPPPQAAPGTESQAQPGGDKPAPVIPFQATANA